MSHDAALRSRIDAFFNAPGLHAIWMYRISHYLWMHHMRFLARLVSTVTRAVTGVEIHPGATIGRCLYIDHGSGCVIGETAVIGDDVLMYHGVTIGGVDMKKGQRHATVGNRVLLGAGAKILGRIHVGDDAKIGANAVVTRDVPAGATAVGNPAKITTPVVHTLQDYEPIADDYII